MSKTFKFNKLPKIKEINCSSCGKVKKSKNVAVNIEDENEELCNGCFGLLLSKNKIQKI